MKNIQRMLRGLSGLLVLAVAPSLASAQGLIPFPDATAQTVNPGVAPPSSNPLGTSYGRWGSEWVKWVMGLPATGHPLFQAGQVKCSDNQVGHVWFLVGIWGANTVQRSCDVPSGTWLFFPLINVWADNVGYQKTPPTNYSAAELKQMAGDFILAGELHATIDGKPVQGLFAYRAADAGFSYNLPPTDNMQQIQGNDAPGAAWPPDKPMVGPVACDGYWLMLEPLSPGAHTISFGGSAKNGYLQVDVSYSINVIPKGRL